MNHSGIRDRYIDKYREIIMECINCVESNLYAAPPSCWNTSTYRLRTLRFVACDLGLGGGGAPVGFILVPVGVLGADSIGGARLERIRIGALTGGSLKSIADTERKGGALPGGGFGFEPVIPGEAVCAREGGGGGVAGFSGSALPALRLTHRFCSLS